ncbi:MAG: UpxY family transcription antiterminator [Chlorobi bacterium]|nr:UpxY family transcription antiterminator [Chlorobiota bacterium]
MGENRNNNIHWYAVYTRPRNEKKVRDLLTNSGFECYLPMVKTLRLWSDRKKWVYFPLFRSYIFVRIDLKDYHDVLNTEGIVKFIRFGDGPVPIPEKQIKAIRMYEKSGEIIHDQEIDIQIGDSVEVIHGPLKGLSGKMVAVNRRKKVQIIIEGVQHSVYLYIPRSFLRKIPGAATV